MKDSEYIQPECETVDWIVYAEYIAYQLGQIRQDVKDVLDEQNGEVSP
jgi:hypothetical protein